jgi:hypothetical protein
MKRTTFLVALLFMGTAFFSGAGAAFAAEENDAQTTVDKAEITLKSFMADENFKNCASSPKRRRAS